MKLIQLINATIFITVVLSSGCIIYPEKAVSDGYTGRIYNQDTNQPVSKREVIICLDKNEFKRKTDQDGFFLIPKKEHWYISWIMCGPILVIEKPDIAKISVNGFYDKKYCFRSEISQCEPESNVITRRYDVSGDVSLGDIYLVPKKE